MDHDLYVVHYPVSGEPTIEGVPEQPDSDNTLAVAKAWANDKVTRHPGSRAVILSGPIYATDHITTWHM
jgi:hypothetical protein